MTKISHWGKPFALLALVFSPVGGMNANATIYSGPPTVDLLQKYKVPHPNPPLSKGRELVAPLDKGGLRGV
ncbi:MAG: hypothetical protein AB1589_35020, partial [Cyanobacteriota bacterium]